MQSPQFQLHADIEDRHWWFVARRRIMRTLVQEVLPPSRESLIIDIGCGTGANLGSLSNCYEAVGIDTSAEAITLARSRFPGVEFLHGLAPGDLGERMDRARLIMLMDVLEHVADDSKYLAELVSAARPRTLFFVTVPADQSLWSRHDESFGHYRRYGRRRLEQAWAGLPVNVLLLSHFNSRLLPLIRMARSRNRRRGQSAGVAGTDFWLPIAPANRLLTRIMAGEAKRLVAALRGRAAEYSAGASLVALLRKCDGAL